ncbi:MAG: hypothetical protein COW67_05135 [Flavobacteriales bacterium CG18_big_fil_WC_8_21_14_2_50_32_9]|nr:MAG: hypothetical protein COW67_05135 [Flavobacteriales bacterium CG18_big_fil_WC_8_21_14_2_50_32_9]PJC61955.1 MAG: hypothetical protein CO022_07095 [Flavobacteriales bacterium CG_4_9_14_0_2_um_filter_32_27]
MKPLSKLLIISLIAFLYACSSSIPFTNDDKVKYNLDEASLKKVQFFVSRDIILQRGERTNEAQEFDKDGKLIISSSATLDEIFIKEGTPGVLVKMIDGNKLAISFDAVDDNKYLVFGDPNNRGRYNLMGAEWNNGKGKISYGGKVYYVMPGGAGAYLKYKMKKVNDNRKSQSTVKGRKVN